MAKKTKPDRAPISPDTQTGRYEIDYFKVQHSLYRKEVADWQEARAARRDPFRPITYPIQQLYRDAMLDNHLAGAIENRILRVANKQFILKDKNDKPDPERSAFVQSRWFKLIVRRAIESKFFGYSALFIADVQPGRIVHVVDLPRENIIPEFGFLLKNPLFVEGEKLNFGNYPTSLILLQLGTDNVGILERIAPLTVFKRHSWASWDEFEQLFGIPIRIARTMVDTPKHRDELESWLRNLGSSAYAIFDKRVDIELKENNRADAHKVFSEKIKAINSEISKGILGQTMTMDDGSSQSQANVHLQTLDEISAADMADIEDWFNSEFVHTLRNIGYDIPEGHYLDIVANSAINPADKIKVDAALMAAGWQLDPDYIEQTYEVKLANGTQTAQGNTLSFFV